MPAVCLMREDLGNGVDLQLRQRVVRDASDKGACPLSLPERLRHRPTEADEVDEPEGEEHVDYEHNLVINRHVLNDAEQLLVKHFDNEREPVEEVAVKPLNQERHRVFV
eukprot:CAMPEP_0196749144 /NCGR_PEP_ID=MMETSP1091-20130531/75823_1 /TAXON_ID=302021 /ORGANISM="Rhodomonas sp., Strain CCMP768" /LENGTH=108 /DNA_ID=CAMNT_0042096575 /DNA_START=197 /DNA_END=523 /DNA_ORIENTATION=+